MVTLTATQTMKVTIHCTGTRKNEPAKLCNHVLGILDVEQFVGTLSIKCPKCGTVAIFR